MPTLGCGDAVAALQDDVSDVKGALLRMADSSIINLGPDAHEIEEIISTCGL